MAAKYVIGIDLGTTNCALAYTPIDTAKPEVQVLPIPQLVAPGTVESRTLLPSFVYLAQEHEVKARSFDLLKAKGRDFVVGELARRQSAEMPDRTVVAAKSGLFVPGSRYEMKASVYGRLLSRTMGSCFTGPSVMAGRDGNAFRGIDS